MSGQTIILHGDRARFQARRLIDVAPPGAVVNVREARRTNAQNDKMHAMLSDIARAKPGGRVLAPDKWKCIFMDAVANETGKPGFKAHWEPSLDGEGVVNVGYRSSRLSKADMGDLIDFMQAWGDQNGIEWTEPNSETPHVE